MTSPERIPQRRIGSLSVSALGLGCMGMTLAYSRSDRRRSLATLNHALDQGINLLDTADVYGAGRNERLLSQVLRQGGGEVVIATKFGIRAWPLIGLPRGLSATPERALRCADASLRRLGVSEIDLYYLHRPDPDVPIEDTVDAMAELVQAGKVREIGLSEASAATVRRAAAVHPIAALQSEWSVFSRDIEAGIVPAARQAGATLVPYSPLGRGMLTGAAPQRPGRLDFRRTLPRWSAANRDHNLRLVDTITSLARRMGITTAQLALAWLLAQGDDIVPIPGTTRPAAIDENLAAATVQLPADALASLSELRPRGDRYADMSEVAGDTRPAA